MLNNAQQSMFSYSRLYFLYYLIKFLIIITLIINHVCILINKYHNILKTLNLFSNHSYQTHSFQYVSIHLNIYKPMFMKYMFLF